MCRASDCIIGLSALVVFSLLAALAHAAVTDARAIRLQVRPLVSFAPSNWNIQVRVHPEPEDRWITVQTDNGDFQRLSGFTIEGDRALYTVYWRDVPAGEYELVAAIGHGNVVRGQDRLTLKVQGIFGQ